MHWTGFPILAVCRNFIDVACLDTPEDASLTTILAVSSLPMVASQVIYHLHLNIEGCVLCEAGMANRASEAQG